VTQRRHGSTGPRIEPFRPGGGSYTVVLQDTTQGGGDQQPAAHSIAAARIRSVRAARPGQLLTHQALK
jgi:hypothetical protein